MLPSAGIFLRHVAFTGLGDATSSAQGPYPLVTHGVFCCVQEFVLFRENCIGPGSTPATEVSLEKFAELWLRWLKHVFVLLLRIQSLWNEQLPQLVYILQKVGAFVLLFLVSVFRGIFGSARV